MRRLVFGLLFGIGGYLVSANWARPDRLGAWWATIGSTRKRAGRKRRGTEG
jgi:hypothetical protein